MMNELVIIKLFLKKENYTKYINNIYTINLQVETKKIINTIISYYNNYNSHIYISIDELEQYFILLHPSDKVNQNYTKLFERLRTMEVSDSVAVDTFQTMLEQAYAAKVFEVVLPLMRGESRGTLYELPQIIQSFKEETSRLDQEVSPFVDTGNLDTLFEELDPSVGIRWGLRYLNENIGPLRGGTQGHFFARVEAGKTSFVVSQLSAFAPQLKEDEVILGCFNEEDGKFIVRRTACSMLGISQEEYVARLRLGQADQLKKKLEELGFFKIKFLYKPDLTYEDILEQVEKHKIRILVVDIADHLSFRGVVGSDVTIASKLGEIYRKLRAIAGNYGCDIITVGQAAATADNKKYLTSADMHNSKVDKPGALDYNIGMSFDMNEEQVGASRRYMTIVKNKIGVTKQASAVVLFDKLLGRFQDV